jgi:hypothetical protein
VPHALDELGAAGIGLFGIRAGMDGVAKHTERSEQRTAPTARPARRRAMANA